MNDNSMFVGYVYVMKNDVNDKVYIGQTSKSLKWRIMRHCEISRTPGKHDYKLSIAIREIGEDHFGIYELAKVYARTYKELKSILEPLERMYIMTFDSYNNGYNCTIGGSGTLKVKHSETAKMNYRIANSKRGFPESVLKKAIIKNSKKTLQYTLEGKFVAEYKSVRSASIETGINKSCIAHVCQGIQKSAGGYIFKYAD